MKETIHILLVEDDPWDRDIIAMTLNKGLEDVHVDIVDSRSALKAFLKKGKADIILSDYKLDSFTGIDVLDELKACNLNIPIIMLTDEGAVDLALDAMSRGIHEHVTKSLKQIRLLPAKISRLLAINYADVKSAYIPKTQSSQTDKQLAANSLLDSSQYISVFEDSAIGVAVGDSQGNIIEVNEAGANMIGFNKAELLGKSFIEIIHPDDRNEIRENFADLFSGDKNGYQLERRYLHKDGKTVWCDISVSLIKDVEGHPHHAIVQAKDITSRKQAEEISKVLLESAPEAIIISNDEGVIEIINKQAEKLFGYSQEELVGHKVEVLIPKKHQKTHPSNRKGQFKSPSTLAMNGISREVYALDKQGREFPIDIRLSHFETEKGHYVTAGVRDISEQKQLISALRESQEKFSTAFRSSPDAISISSADVGTFIEVNDRFLEMSGFSQDEVIGHTAIELDIWVDQKQHDLMFKMLMEKGCLKTFETEYQKKSGEIIICQLSAELIELNNEQCMLIVTRDISDKKKAELELLSYEQIVSSAREFMSIVDHNYTYISVNQYYLDQFEKNRDEIVGHTVEELHGKKTFEKEVKKDIDRALDGEHVNFKRWIELPKGKRYVDTEYSPFIDTDGKVGGVVVSSRDITQRYLAEQEQKESEERFRGLFEHGPLGMGLGDRNGNIIQVNEALCNVSGWTEKELVGKNFKEFIHPDDIELSIKNLKRLFTGEIDHYKQTRRYLHKKGHYTWVDINVSVINDAEGKPNLLINYLQDVNDRIQSESLQEAQRKIFEGIVSGVSQKKILSDLCLMFESLAPAGAKAAILLLNPDDEKLYVAAAPNLADEVTNTFDGFMIGDGRVSCGTAAYTGKQIIDEDVSSSLLWKDFREFALENKILACWSTPFFSENDDVLGTFAIALPRPSSPSKLDLERINLAANLTSIVLERTLSEEALRKSEARFRGAFEEASLGMSLESPENRYLSVNDAFCKMLGYSREELISTSCFNITHVNDREENLHYLKRLEQGKDSLLNLEKRFIHKKGHTVCVQMGTVAVRDQDGKLLEYVSQVQDITERKHLENLKTSRTLILESLAKNYPLEQTFHMLVTSTIKLVPDMFVSILLVDKKGTCLNHAVSHGLPDSYIEEVDGMEFREGVGSCGSAAATGKRVVVADIYNHPYWVDFLELAKKAGVRSCWSEPIISSLGKVLGTFALYYKDVREPTEAEIELIENQTNLAAIAIERIRDEEELRESEARFRSAFGNAPMGTALINNNGVVIQANSRSKEIIGFTPEEIIGKSIHEISHPDDKDGSMKKFKELMSGEIENYQMENRYKHKQGGYVWCRLSISSVLDNDNQPMYAIAHIENITERKLSVEKLRCSEEKYRAIFESSQVGMVLCKMDGTLVDTNRGYLDIIGYSKEESLKLTYWDITPREYQEEEAEQLRSIVETGQYGPYEKEYIHKDGSKIPVLLNGTVVKGEIGDEYIWSMVENISERKKAEQALIRSHRSLKVLNECNHTLVHTDDLQDLLDKICNIITEIGGYPFAWIGYVVPDDNKSIKTVATSVNDSGYLLECKVSWGDNEFGHGPLGKVIRSGERYIVEDIATDPCFEQWKDAALERGYRSEIVLPLKAGDQSFGTIAIYSDEVNSFSNKEELLLLTSLAENLSYGILSLQSKYEQAKAEDSLHQSEHKYRAIYDENPAIFITVDNSGNVLSVNKFAAEKFGYTVEEMLGTSIFSMCHKDDVLETRRQHKDCFDVPGKIHSWESRRIRKDGSDFWVRETVRVSYDTDKEPMLLIVSDDISEARALSKELSYQASHDPLTKLVNRREFELRTERLLDSIKQDNSSHALCYMDLDQFKIVNDTCGHTAGDEMLRQLSNELTDSMRHRDTLARLGGDEFGVLMEHCSLDDAQRVAISIQRKIQNFKFIWEGNVFRVGVSIGLVSIDESTSNLSNLLKDADSACYTAKDMGRNRIHVYHAEDSDIAQRHGEIQWLARLNQALDKGWLSLYAQAIIPLDGSAEAHYEFLLRMIDDKGESFSPGVFLPAAERYNLMSAIDSWVIENAMNILTKNPVFLNQVKFCSINLSGQSLTSPDMLKFIINKLGESGIDGRKICFEITETAAITNLKSAKTFISSLKALGCKFALDDFGSGLSSFGYLKNLPVDYLKIDGMFVKDIVDDQIDRAMVKSINEIGQVMGMLTIAEFVENDEIKGMLREIGVNYAQGYGIGKPQPLADLIDRANNITDINSAKKSDTGNPG
jgi:diguanylate cyclase (GGDEF)-like protein/PAS domain S-box-containing protein